MGRVISTHPELCDVRIGGSKMTHPTEFASLILVFATRHEELRVVCSNVMFELDDDRSESP